MLFLLDFILTLKEPCVWFWVLNGKKKKKKHFKSEASFLEPSGTFFLALIANLPLQMPPKIYSSREKVAKIVNLILKQNKE